MHWRSGPGTKEVLTLRAGASLAGDFHFHGGTPWRVLQTSNGAPASVRA